VRRRGAGVTALAVLASGLLLTACSPYDLTGVKLSEAGAPVLTNCGTYFMGVEVYDVDTTRLVWAADKSPGSSDDGVGDIVVGVLPESDWTETAAFDLQPVPSNWRFVIERLGYEEPLTLTAANSALSVNQVFIPESGKTVPANKFMGETCGYDPPISRAAQRTAMIVLGAVAVLVAAVLVGRKVRHRQRESV